MGIADGGELPIRDLTRDREQATSYRAVKLTHGDGGKGCERFGHGVNPTNLLRPKPLESGNRRQQGQDPNYYSANLQEGIRRTRSLPVKVSGSLKQRPPADHPPGEGVPVSQKNGRSKPGINTSQSRGLPEVPLHGRRSSIARAKLAHPGPPGSETRPRQFKPRPCRYSGRISSTLSTKKPRKAGMTFMAVARVLQRRAVQHRSRLSQDIQWRSTGRGVCG